MRSVANLIGFLTISLTFGNGRRVLANSGSSSCVGAEPSTAASVTAVILFLDEEIRRLAVGP